MFLLKYATIIHSTLISIDYIHNESMRAYLLITFYCFLLSLFLDITDMSDRLSLIHIWTENTPFSFHLPLLILYFSLFMPPSICLLYTSKHLFFIYPINNHRKQCCHCSRFDRDKRGSGKYGCGRCSCQTYP